MVIDMAYEDLSEIQIKILEYIKKGNSIKRLSPICERDV